MDDDDAISLVGRALFTRFLGDRHLLTALNPDPAAAAELFDDAERAITTSEWLDATFNGDFLPMSSDIYKALPPEAYKVLGDILRRAPAGQLFLGWAERWDNLDFAHIPVGVLSQAYEHYLRQHAPDRQRQEGGYYTPRPIADLMVRGAIRGLGREDHAAGARVLDPAAGAGVFLLTAFRQLVAERWRQDGVRPETGVLRDILYQQITGFDINEAALRFAALGLYLISIELDPHPEPVRKLRFDNLRDQVLLKVGSVENGAPRSLGSLGPAVGNEHVGRYDLVIGNPPWASATQLPDWHLVQRIVADIARSRLPEGTAPPPIPNEVLDLPFVWRAMAWAKEGGQIAFALHARVLFQQGDGMQEARRALFSALDVTAVVNGVELRQTRVWPEISAPFCLIYARNQVPPRGAGFRLISPRLEPTLNTAGGMRVDASNAELITAAQIAERPEILKILFRGTQADLQVYDRVRARKLETLDAYWRRLFGSDGARPRFSGNGYQRLRKSSRVRKSGDGLPGVSASYLHDLPELTNEAADDLLVDTTQLSAFGDGRLHDPRPRRLFQAPLLIVHKSPPASGERIRVAVAEQDVVFSETYYGYSAKDHPQGNELTRFLALILSSKPALWMTLITSGEFGFEREVIEKSTIDGVLVPDFDELKGSEQAAIASLFTAAQRGEPGAWASVDEWVSALYGLRPRDLQVIKDTLEYNLPFAANRRKAQMRPSDSAVNQFCRVLDAELKPWADRFGKTIAAAPCASLAASPWRSIRICSDDGRSGHRDVGLDWSKFLPLADHYAATEVALTADDGCLWLGRLDQARYWSETQARQLAQRVIWEHVDLLKGREPA